MGLTGIILSGGKSSRMGKEKGKCLLKGKPLIEYSFELLKNICDTVIISANSNDYDYLGCRVVKDDVEGMGPAGGIYSALKASETTDNIVISADMPILSAGLLGYVLSFKKNLEAVIPIFNGYPEPLCAYYRKSCISVFGKSLKTGKYKMLEIIKELNCEFVEIEPSLSIYGHHLFTNVNTPEDLVRIELQLTMNPSAHE
jgi:molybdopterin-guanine dinucleotide biosynthesis protein A